MRKKHFHPNYTQYCTVGDFENFDNNFDKKKIIFNEHDVRIAF